MAYESNDNMVSHPNHYQSGKYEVIDVIEEFTKELEGIEAVDTANAIKYILRWKKKNGKQDIEKAIWYLTHLKEHLECENVILDVDNFGAAIVRKLCKCTNEDKEEIKWCRNCKHQFKSLNDKICEPCLIAEEGYPNWEAKEEEKKVYKNCKNCKYYNNSLFEYPCSKCDIFIFQKWEKWEPKEKPPIINTCSTCKYLLLDTFVEPCSTCLTKVGEYPNWEAKDEKKAEK